MQVSCFIDHRLGYGVYQHVGGCSGALGLLNFWCQKGGRNLSLAGPAILICGCGSGGRAKSYRNVVHPLRYQKLLQWKQPLFKVLTHTVY